MSEELKPCPFCGGSEIYVEEYEHHPGAVRWRVFCAGCMAGIDTGTRQSMGQAVPDWNRRAELTCRMEYAGEVPPQVKYGCYFCSKCGSPIYSDKEPSYCLYCGAKVVSGDGDR